MERRTVVQAALNVVGDVQSTPCIHCGAEISIADLACGIFRCGIIKRTNRQIPPHASKNVCDLLVASGAIWGCGKPFRARPTPSGSYLLEPCEYI